MTEPTGGTIREEIAAANELFMAAAKRGDAAGLAALYTEDGWLLPPNSDIVKGRPGIQAVWQSILDMGIESALMEIVEVEQYGDTAIDVSTYTMTVQGGQVADKGKYIVIWKKVAGEWKLHRDIFNSSMPPPG